MGIGEKLYLMATFKNNNKSDRVGQMSLDAIKVYLDKLVKNEVVTRSELAERRKALANWGLKPHEVEQKIYSALSAKTLKASGVAQPQSGKYMKVDLQKPRLSSPNWRRAEGLAAENDFRRRLNASDYSALQNKQVRNVLHNPQTKAMIQKSLKSEADGEHEKKKKEKKARRKAARALTGTEKGDWWDPIVKMGADLVPKLLPMLIGMGDYVDPEDLPLKTAETPTSNSLLAAVTEGEKGYEVPFMHTHGEKTRVTHREYIGDVYSSTAAFTTQTFAINPGMQELFPWCAPVANCYTNYRLMGAVVDFVSQGSDYANVAGLGYVALATQYNPLEAPFQDKRELLNYEYADAVKPSRNMTHWIECKPSDVPEPEKSVRAGTIPANSDLRLYDHGKLWVAVGGNTADNSIIGQLWITYDLEFYFPKVSNSAAGVLNFAGYIRSGSGPLLSCGTATAGTGTRNSIVIVFTTNTFAFSSSIRGDFLVVCNWTGTVGCTGVVAPIWSANASNTVAVVYAGSPLVGEFSYCQILVCSVLEDNATFTSINNATTLASSNSTVDFKFTQIPRAPALVSSILDLGGKNSADRYSVFMDQVKKKELVAMGMKNVKSLSTLEEDEGDSDMVIFRRVGRYAYCQMDCSTVFVTDQFCSAKSEYYFLDLENCRAHEIFDQNYEFMTKQQFIEAIKFFIKWYGQDVDKVPDKINLAAEPPENDVCDLIVVLRDEDGYRFSSGETDKGVVGVVSRVETDTNEKFAATLDRSNAFESAFSDTYLKLSVSEFKMMIDAILKMRKTLNVLSRENIR